MGFHTFDADRADDLEDPGRYEYLSAEELRATAAIEPGDVVLDLGSGTGFYTDVLATDGGIVIALDVQPSMARYYRRKGTPANVAVLVADAGRLPLGTGTVDVAASTMTYHELPRAALEELHRVLSPGGRVVVVDWTAEGPGEAGPPVTERFDAETAATALEASGFTVRRVEPRRETFLVVATR